MASRSKLEFFRFSIKPKKQGHKTFKDFVIDELKAKATISNSDAFKLCFKHFMTSLETDHAKNERHKKTITVIANPKTNPYLRSKPTMHDDLKVIAGVINGGPYDKDAIVSDITDKEQNSILGRNKSVLTPYFIFIYLPPDHHEGFLAIHSSGSDGTITSIVREYIANLFKGEGYYKAIPEVYCPKSFQKEFRDDAIIKSMTYSTSITENTHGTDALTTILSDYQIKIEVVPKRKKLHMQQAGKMISFFSKKVFGTGNDRKIRLNEFKTKKIHTENAVTKAPKVFEWNSKDNDFIPVVYLDGRVKLNRGVPDFDDLKKYCLDLFKSEILNELRPDLNATKTK